ncbi:hypothetical protein GCM10009775_18530 [Microbacterium aoyamense]|uniref:Rhodanese domain-containing protein n=2 Tax=Microbacterium aoyamense TaxID=344166 RepID=A0ABN2PPB3_9MICO
MQRSRPRWRSAAVIAVLVASIVVPSTATAAPRPVLETSSAQAERLSGASRYETAARIAEEFPVGVEALYVATGLDFPDALSAAAAAAHFGGPLLVTAPDALPAVVEEEIRARAPQRIVVVGGRSVVSDAVVATLETIAPTTRMAETDRYGTGRSIVEDAFGAQGASTVFLATGRQFPDALAASGAAAAMDAPVVLVDGAASSIPAATMAMLAGLGVESVSIAGGYGAVSADIQGQLQAVGFVVNRYGGPSRFDTAALINQAFFPADGPSGTLLAGGMDYPDALAGAALAGHWGVPLFITSRDCIPAGIHSALAQRPADEVRTLGGTGVVSEAAASLEPCVAPDTSVIDETWASGGWDFATDVDAPYSDRPPVDVRNPARGLDPTGLLIYYRVYTRIREDHPVAYAQYGISALLEYERTGETRWLRSAVRHAEQLAAIRVPRGDAWWFPYKFPWSYDDRRLSPPWWSGMAQGEALSLFTRLAVETGEERWDVAAHATWLSFTQPRAETGPWSTFVRNGSLVFEEYAKGGVPPLVVLNGHAFAVFGLYDYWKYTGDPEVERYLDGGAQTVLDWMPSIRNPGGISYYCADEAYCQRKFWENSTYHVIHSWQLDTLARITRDPEFSEWAQLLREDWVPPAGRMPTTAPWDIDPLDVAPAD